MNKNSIISNLSPLNSLDKMSTTVYIIKKSLAFLLIYCIGAIAGEAIIIALLYAIGYDPLHGIMPTGSMGVLLPYYGFSVFLLTVILYCRFIEKRDLKSLGLNEKVYDYLMGGLVAIILLAVIIVFCCITNAISYIGVNENIDIKYIIGLFIGFVIQSTAEETMCRGFLLQSLLKKTSVPIAVFVSSTAFSLPHFLTLFEAEIKYSIIGVANLYLISVIFSLLVIFRSNIWIACGLHSSWNFILYGFMGLSLSGNAVDSYGIIKFEADAESIISGGIYGIEAGIITTVVLGIVIIAMLKYWHDKRCRHGI